MGCTISEPQVQMVSGPDLLGASVIICHHICSVYACSTVGYAWPWVQVCSVWSESLKVKGNTMKSLFRLVLVALLAVPSLGHAADELLRLQDDDTQWGCRPRITPTLVTAH